MKEILLTQGKIALVDDEDYDRVNAFKWHTENYNNRLYAKRGILINGKLKTQRMHQFIIGENVLKLDIDHIDNNGLNNQKNNLRLCTHSQNMMNQEKQKNRSTKYKGVSFHKRDNIYQSNIRSNGKLIYLGSFISEIEAAKEYDKKAKELFGDFARLNFTD